MALAGESAQVIVQRIRITSRQVGWDDEPQAAQIGGDGWADVGNFFKAGKLLTLLFHLLPPY